jgi:hypothetical protein
MPWHKHGKVDRLKTVGLLAFGSFSIHFVSELIVAMPAA